MSDGTDNWPQELELDLTGIAQGGDAVGRYESRAVFVAGALPGERVRVRLHDRQRSFARGTAVEIMRPAPERQPSFCPLETTCGAGDWRWIDYAAQLRFKAQILQDQLRHLGGIEIDVDPPSAPNTLPLAYRTTAELHGDRGRLGYYQPGSRRVADLPACCLHHPAINQTLGSLRSLLTEDLWLRSATIRCNPATGQTLGVLDGKKRHEIAERWMESEPTLIGVTDRHGVSLVGETSLDQVVAGLQFRVSATSFFQINFLQWEPLVARVRELIEPTPKTRLLDLYCGVGLFALTLAREVDHVVGVEAYKTAVEDAQYNARRNGIDNVHFRDASAEAVLPVYHGNVDRIVLDPPRRGCEPAVLDALAELRPKRIVYVSCHPGTLARDCKHLTQHGYHVRSAEIIDMFPHTSHVESIVALDRNMQT